MKCMVDLCVIPIGQGVSVADEIAQCQRILARFDIDTKLHAYGTTLHGEWDEVFAAVKACHQELHEAGVTRLSSTLKVGTRTDKEQTFADKKQAVIDRLSKD
ncbi:MTH1187 family thiamine-binding protein [Saccharospirillum mangrovi]|uniref:MTH1187 family thiamine-binding protein n=1 Tax=Saccharospirillum mangrovi TaxID=2161747 RepID=UPI000D3659F4|nr:MTH1187 family thiamine-binding protein [Saccharospirillum mangrovi]